MKTSALLIVALFPICACYAAGTDDLPKSWASLGIKTGMPYTAAKQLLLKSGWAVAVNEGQASHPQLPEIECGEGHDAICSAGFSKGQESYGLLVSQSRGGLLVVNGVY